MPTQETPDTAPVPRFVTLVEASRRTGVSEDTIRRRVKDGTIPAVLLARKYRIREDDLAAWVEGKAA